MHRLGASRIWLSVPKLVCLVVGPCIAVADLRAQEASILVTVLDERTGEVVTGLGPERFSVKDGDFPLRVLSATEPRSSVDVLLLVDTSIAGDAVRPLAEALVEEVGDSDSMAIVAFNESAELLQDFTSEKAFLRRALRRIEYNGLPRLHDALLASVEDAFAGSANREAVVLLSNGAIARSRVSEAEVIEAARARRVSIYSVFVRNDARALLRRFALRTGGASFAPRRLKLEPRRLASKVLAAVRSPYEISVSGVYTLGNSIEVTARGATGTGRLTASALAVD